ncbi:3-phosphoserine/phosphohydroxythreonine transaminase [Desertibacillus haloalkaliphilus]|uniref:3-phosphoserine/phosphohydroxythreonine transaminase n=1 Tax=Desertibacillus haloalkaliphilus TaxID=1328930 RepID=UPI001C25F029|nr:3-phosphoserine/phosphohydroxythreonine transaminase [Desertibacillus haloalkaliphilus]MBU8905458.1 3-phosphoserine/phosphohydroxythreonine transaminase [Desertibacillus haloalkaliphilus]
MERAYNFNAGPTALPVDVLKKAQAELVNFQNTGMSVMELSHRSKEYEAVHNKAQSLLRELLQIPDNYEVLLLQGGASTQFTMIPMNFLSDGQQGNYVLTGSWSEKALKEGKLLGATTIGASSKESGYTFIPAPNDITINDNDAYLHITSNNTIYGTQWQEFPSFGDTNVIADMSSDILSRPLPVNNFSMIYAGAQKNLGPSGVTVVILRKDLMEKTPENVPTMLRYDTHAGKNSLYNTPPTFGIYMLANVLEWVKEQGGTSGIEARNIEKANMIYDVIDESNGFYKGHAEKNSRSLMNITFNLPSEELNQEFLAKAKEKGFVGLNGHRSVGGCRASTYNAVTPEACEALRQFMIEFKNQK